MGSLTPPGHHGAPIGEGAFAPVYDALGATFCADRFTHQQVWECSQVAGVRVWESHRSEVWMFVPYNAAEVVSVMLAVLPRLLTWQPGASFDPVARALPRDARLRPYQLEVVHQFALPQCGERLLLADAMGLGKTASAIACMKLRGGPKLIIGPKSLRSTWRAELQKWAPGERFDFIETIQPAVVFQEALPDISALRWVYIHYDLVHAWWSWLRLVPFTGVVLDEAHTVKNVTTLRGRAVMQAVGAIPARVILTGTPIENRVAEFHHLLELLTGKGTWGSKGAFRIRYAGAKPNIHGGLVDGAPTHTDELQQRIQHHYMRRTVSMVRQQGLELPPVERIPVPVPLDDKAVAKLQKVLTPAALHALNLWRQTGTLPSAEDHQAIKAIGALRAAVSKHKVEATVQTVRRHLEAGDQVVVFTWTRDMAAHLATHFSAVSDGAGATVITGEQSLGARDKAVFTFRERCEAGRRGVLIATYGALGVGVNLQCANVVLLHDLDWTPGVMLQAEARVWRGGQRRNVLSYWMVADATFDEYIIRTLLSKADEIVAAIGDEEPQQLREAFSVYARPEAGVEDFVQQLALWAKNRI